MLRRKAQSARVAFQPLAFVAALLLCSGCGGAAVSPRVLFTEKNARAVLVPTRFVWLSSLRKTGFLPDSIGLGGKTSGRVILYFEFPAAERRTSQLLRAYLVLDATEERMSTSRVRIEFSRAQPGRADMGSWGDQPRAVFPRLSAELAPNGAPLRLDVTELVLPSLKDQQVTRLMLISEPGEAEGVHIATGAATGVVPRLELYWQ